MASIVFHSLSPALHTQRRLRVILPDSRRNDTNLPWLLLLHGSGADGSRWLRMTRAEYYAEAKGIALILPDGDNGYYTDMRHGYKYYTYLTEDVEADVRRHFPGLSRDPQKRYVAGFGIGGFGALKYALDFPGRFRAAGSFAGSLDPQSLDPDYSVAAFGSLKQAWEVENDLFNRLRTAIADDTRLPDLYFSCGREELLYFDSDYDAIPDCAANPDCAAFSVLTARVGCQNLNAADPWLSADRSLAWFLDRIYPYRTQVFTPPADFLEWRQPAAGSVTNSPPENPAAE